jgi:Flp pilus assembly protein TadD
MLLGSSLLASFAPATAQELSGITSREVVQPLPTPEVAQLNEALRELARKPRDVATLIAAGKAALNLNDLDAAMGFFGRAQDIEADNPQVKMGMAAAYLRSGSPIEALRLFNEAEAAGASAREVMLERALAYDLVGNNAEAQTAYRAAQRINPTDEGVRRLALSLAISGSAEEFETVLRPLLERRDFAAYRTRAFGLAILGDTQEAAAIADAVMPRDLASRMIPYLEFMPRLTKSQQAAAANLGIFPRAAEIGREDPRIAQFAREGAEIASAASDRLAPSGTPLGSRVEAEEASEDTAVRLTRAEPAESANPVPGFDLARFGESEAQNRREPASVADAFAGLADERPVQREAADGAVDINAIEIPREAEPAEPPKQLHPSRQWVQVATGRDRSALQFDWRRFARTAPELLGDLDPHITSWGRTNRLLAGPMDSVSAARDLVNALKQKGIDTFRFTSAEGQEVQRLR